jgi:hypothetical protein
VDRVHGPVGSCGPRPRPRSTVDPAHLSRSDLDLTAQIGSGGAAGRPAAGDEQPVAAPRRSARNCAPTTKTGRRFTDSVEGDAAVLTVGLRTSGRRRRAAGDDAKRRRRSGEVGDGVPAVGDGRGGSEEVRRGARVTDQVAARPKRYGRRRIDSGGGMRSRRRWRRLL